MAGPTNSLGGYNSWEQDYGDFFSGGMTPPVAGGGMVTQRMNLATPAMRASAPPPWTTNGPAMFQMAQELARAPATRYAVDAGGQRIDPFKLGYGGPAAQNPAVTAATQAGQGVAPPFPASVDDRLNARANAANRAWLEAQAGNPSMGGEIRPPWTIPQQPQGANPGMGGAIIGDGQMNPGIPPQLPPADGSSPLPVWAGDNPQQQGGPLGISVRGGQRPKVSPSERYSLANMLGQIKAKERQSNATGQAGGYQYKNGQRVGYASQKVGNTTITPGSGSQAYALANVVGQINALNKQATATGNTGVYSYKNGVKTGTVNGGSSASAYEAAASKARYGTGSNGGNPDWW